MVTYDELVKLANEFPYLERKRSETWREFNLHLFGNPTISASEYLRMLPPLKMETVYKVGEQA